MRILFYLPVVTPWWFDHVIGHLIRRLAPAAELHVLVPPLWRGTGIGAEQLLPFADLDAVHWHILDGDDHPRLRGRDVDCPGIVELVEAIAPDHVLCRSADTALPARFPGKVSYIMEGGAPPFPMEDFWVAFQPRLFDHGCLPELEPAHARALDEAVAPAWARLKARFPRHDAWLERMGLPTGPKVIALPLEYAHEENFFGAYRTHWHNPDLVLDLAGRLDPSFFLAVTNHPLNELYVDGADLEAALARVADRAKLVACGTAPLAQHAAGMIVENSKSFAIAAFFGTPVLRLSEFDTGAWLNAFDDLDAFAAALAAGGTRGAREADARLWFAFHIANNLVDPTHPGLDAAEIIARLEQPVDPRRWATGFERYAAARPELFA